MRASAGASVLIPNPIQQINKPFPYLEYFCFFVDITESSMLLP